MYLPVLLWSLNTRCASLLKERKEWNESVREVRHQSVIAVITHRAIQHVISDKPLLRFRMPPERSLMPVNVHIVFKATCANFTCC
jgi:hypothetical protein